MFIIFGKDSCPQCDTVKHILENNNQEYIYKKLDVDYSREELLEFCGKFNVFPRQLPQVFKKENDHELYFGQMFEVKSAFSS